MNFLDTANKVNTDVPIYNIAYTQNENEQVKVNTKLIQLKTFRASVQLPDDNAIRLHDIDLTSHIRSSLFNEIYSTLDDTLYEKYKILGKLNFSQKLTKWERFLSKWVSSLTFSYYINENSDNLVKAILKENYDLRRSPSDKFLVLSPKMYSYIANSEKFVYAPVNDSSTPNFHTVYMGNICGISVFISNKVDCSDTHILLGTMTREYSEGVFFLDGKHNFTEYDELSLKKTIYLDYRGAIEDVGNARDYFSYFNVKSGKKPLWRKLLNIR